MCRCDIWEFTLFLTETILYCVFIFLLCIMENYLKYGININMTHISHVYYICQTLPSDTIIFIEKKEYVNVVLVGISY